VVLYTGVTYMPFPLPLKEGRRKLIIPAYYAV